MIELQLLDITVFQEVFLTFIIILGYVSFALIFVFVLDLLLDIIKRAVKHRMKRGRR